MKNLLAKHKIEEGNFFTRKNVSVNKPIFVVGCPRSGTTVVGSCLMAHSKLVGSDESLFFIDMWRIFSSLHQGLNRRNSAPLKDYITSAQLIETIGNFSDQIFNGLNLTEGKRFIDHTPWYVNLIPFINLIYPESVFIHVVRYGMDVINSLTASYNKGYWWAGKDVTERSKLWNDLVLEGIQNGKKLGNKRYFEIHYEHFCEDPVKTIDAALNFLGLSFEDKCLIPLAKQHVEPSRKESALAYFNSENKLVLQPHNIVDACYGLSDLQQFELSASEAIQLGGYQKRLNKNKEQSTKL